MGNGLCELQGGVPARYSIDREERLIYGGVKGSRELQSRGELQI